MFAPIPSENIHIDETVGIVAAEKVRQAEHSVHGGGYVSPMPFIAVGDCLILVLQRDLACRTASPAVDRETKTEHRRELITYRELGVRPTRISKGPSPRVS